MPGTPSEHALAGLRLLLVDDNEDGLVMLGAILTRFGAAVTMAPSGVEALAAIEQASPDVLVLDLSMPEMDGLSLLPLLRERLGPVPALAFTAVTGSEVTRDAGAAGFDAIVHKPLNVTQLVAAVAHLAQLRPSPVRG